MPDFTAVFIILLAAGWEFLAPIPGAQAAAAAQEQISVALGNSIKCDGDCVVGLARDAEASGEFRVSLGPRKRIDLIRWLRKPAGTLPARHSWWHSAVPRERDLREELESYAHDHGQPHPAGARAIQRALENGTYTILAFFKKNEMGHLEPTTSIEWILDWDTWTEMKARRDLIEQVILGKESCDLHPILLAAEGPCAGGLKDGQWRFFSAFTGVKSEILEEGRYRKGRRIGKWKEGRDWYVYDNGLRRKVPELKSPL